MMRDAIKRKNRNAGTYITLCVLSVFVLIPIIYMVSTSFKTIDEILTAPKATLFPVSPSAEGYVNMWSKYPFVQYIKNSCIVVLVSTVVAVLFSTLAGYGFSRFNFRGRGALLMFILVTQMFPSVMLYVPYYKLLALMHLSNTHMGLILVYTAA